MQAMTHTGAGGWQLTRTSIALLIAPVSAAAVIKDVIFPGRSNGGRRKS